MAAGGERSLAVRSWRLEVENVVARQREGLGERFNKPMKSLASARGASQRPPSRAGLIFRKASGERGSRLMLFRLIEGLNATLGDWSEYCNEPFRDVLPLDEPASAEGQTDDH